MVAIENQFNNVLLGHLGELPRENILQINEHLHGFPLLIVPDNFEHNFPAFFLHFRPDVPVDETEAYILSSIGIYLSVHADEIVLVFFGCLHWLNSVFIILVNGLSEWELY